MINSIQKSIPKILVIGDLMIDNYLWGDCKRISPEAPVQIINISQETKVLGGAGNVVNNLKTLNANVDVLSVIGSCEISKELKKLLSDINVDTNYLIEEKDRVTSKKTRIISSHQQVIRYDIETEEDINTISADKLINSYSSLVSNYDLIILSDYGKGVLTDHVTKELIKIANSYKIKVIVDPKGSDYSKYTNAYFLTPNKKEACEALGVKISDDKSLKEALISLKKTYNLNTSIITLSDEGIAIYDDKFRSHPTVAREVFDVTGAGDTVIASLGYAIAVDTDIDTAIIFANLAAGVVVGKIGSATTTFEEIIKYQSSLETSDCDKKIKSLDEISNITRELKKSKKKIVFTNGCFDILHLGHVKYLEKAKKNGDILIVGINSDESVTRLKGKTRPINLLYDRSCILASLGSVNYVVPFKEDTPLELIKMILPDILVKGGDYIGKEVVGSNLAKKLVLIDFIEGKSTSNTVSKIQKNDKSY